MSNDNMQTRLAMRMFGDATPEQVIATFRARMEDMLTHPQSASLWEDAERERFTSGKPLPRTVMFMGAFHAACDDHRIPRDDREAIMELVFQPDAPHMMPGQEPYTAAELERVQSFVSGASELQDAMTSDELDELEREVNRGSLQRDGR